MNQKEKWLVWAIVFLFALNVATLGTIIYHNNKQQTPSVTNSVVSTPGTNVVNGRFFKQTLGFTNEQMNLFRQANQQFRPQTAALTFSIDSLKKEMFIEMKKIHPDISKLNSLSEKIGELHSNLKRQTFEFYLKVKATCSQQQKVQLDSVFEPLFINETVQQPPHGMKRGWHNQTN